MKDTELGPQFTPLNYNLSQMEKINNNRLFNELKRDLNPKKNFINYKSQNPEVNFYRNNNSNIEFLRKNYQKKSYKCKKKSIYY